MDKDTRPGTGGDAGAPNDVDLSARLKSLEQRLNQARDTAPGRGGSQDTGRGNASAMGKAFRLSTEFVAGIIAGAGLGWFLDKTLGTRPWGFVVLLLLGFGAGIWNVMRASGFVRPPVPPGGPPSGK